MAGLMLSNIEVKENLLEDEKYKYIFSVEEVNKLVNNGMPFRDAYQKIGREIEAGRFTYSTAISHVHEGSIGNLCNAQIKKQMDSVIDSFPFGKVKEAIDKLLA